MLDTCTTNETATIQSLVGLEAMAGETRLNPDYIVQHVMMSRTCPDPKQTREYVLHVVRNAPHVCRHQITDGIYRLHAEPECSPKCKEAWASERHLPQLPACSNCFTTPSSNGTCLC